MLSEVWEEALMIFFRMGIITAHAFEFIGGFHTVAIVAFFWSLEELLASYRDKKRINQIRQKT